MRTRRERLVGPCRVAGVPVEASVVRDLVGQPRSIRRAGVPGRGDRAQRLVVDDDPLRGIECLGDRFGDDQRHRLAGKADLVRGEQRLRREGEGFAGLDVRLGIGPQRLQPVGFGLGGRQDGQYAGHAAGRPGVDRLDDCMGVRRAQHDGLCHPFKLEIVEIGALSGDEACILAPYG